MRGTRLLIACVAMLAATAEQVQGAILIEITESGSDVLFTTSGSLDISGLTLSNPVGNSLQVSGGGVEHVAFGVGAQDYYGAGSGISGAVLTNTFSSSFAFFGGTALTLVSGGADVGFRTNNANFWVPNNYVSNTSVSQVIRLSGESFASLGINAGEFAELSWTSGAGDSIRMEAVSNAVPEPTSLAIFGVGALGLVVRHRRKQRTA